MYIKSFQSGNPVIMAYRILPYTKDSTQPKSAAPIDSKSESNSKDKVVEDLSKRIDKLEELITHQNAPSGGKFDGLL